MPNPTAQVDGYIRKQKQWSDALQTLRQIVLDCGLTETIKWRTPCYTLDGQNVLIFGAWKDNCSLSFLKGSLMKDPKKLLEKPGPNTQGARLIRFTDAAMVTKLKPTLKAYVKEAIALEKAGLRVDFKAKDELLYPEELEAAFAEQPALKKAFEALTPGRRRAYIMHFTGAKQSKTRTSRIEKAAPMILAGKGMHDA